MIMSILTILWNGYTEAKEDTHLHTGQSQRSQFLHQLTQAYGGHTASINATTLLSVDYKMGSPTLHSHLHHPAQRLLSHIKCRPRSQESKFLLRPLIGAPSLRRSPSATPATAAPVYGDGLTTLERSTKDQGLTQWPEKQPQARDIQVGKTGWWPTQRRVREGGLGTGKDKGNSVPDRGNGNCQGWKV